MRRAMRTLCRSARLRRPLLIAPHTANHRRHFPSRTLRHGGGVVPHVQLPTRDTASWHYRPPRMDSRKRNEQRAAHQWTWSSTSLLYPCVAQDRSTQYQLRRGLCVGTCVLAPLQNWTHLRRTVPVPPMGRQLGCCTLG